MIAVITQTYGNNRHELYDIRSKDSLLQYFIRQFDYELYSFHDCSIETINYFKSVNNCGNYIEYNNITYTQTIYLTIEKLKKLGCKKLIFLQDDVFSFNQDKKELDILILEIKTNHLPMLNLEITPNNFKDFIKDKFKIVSKKDDVEIFKVFSSDFIENGNYSFDDGPFVVDFDLINIIFDNNFFNIGDVWNAENYNNQKFKTMNLPRYLTNKIFFKRYNIVGRNNWDRENELIRLNKNFFKK